MDETPPKPINSPTLQNMGDAPPNQTQDLLPHRQAFQLVVKPGVGVGAHSFLQQEGFDAAQILIRLAQFFIGVAEDLFHVLYARA